METSIKLLFENIYKELFKNKTDINIYEDLYSLIRESDEDEPDLCFEYGKKVKEQLEHNMNNMQNIDYALDLYYRTLLFLSQKDFDSYMLYLEKYRQPEKKFYPPRRKQLKKVVNALQKLTDGELAELFLTMPPRVGKTTILMFYLTWMMGKNPEGSNLYSSYTFTVTKTFYNGILEIVSDANTYAWNEIFPKCSIVRTDSDAGLIDVNRKKKYATLSCRSVEGTLNGALDADSILVADDLLEGIEEALNPDRLNKKWATVENNLLTRCKSTCKILWVGTRWSIGDPIGRRLELLQEDTRFSNIKYELIELPALDENEESNFDYLFGVGFNTEYYLQKRASFEKNNDTASFSAQYMCQPVERDGVLFTPDTMQYFTDLPLGEPDRIFTAIDPSWGGGDYSAGAIAYQYGDQLYITDVIFDDRDKSIVRPIIVDKIIKHNIGSCCIEANKMTEDYAIAINDMLKSKGYRCNIQTKPAPSNISKAQRIYDCASDIRDRCLFLQASARSREYERFMIQLFNYKLIGKNLHDDSPDAMSMLIKFSRVSNHCEVIKRPF